MHAECFDGAELEEAVRLQEGSCQLFQDISDDSDEEECEKEEKVQSIERYKLLGSASKITPFTDLSTHFHEMTCINLPSLLDRVPLLMQYTTPMIMGGFDTLLVSVIGEAELEAIMVPIINQVLITKSTTDKNFFRRPIAVILVHDRFRRKWINAVVDRISRDLDIHSAAITSLDKLARWSENVSDDDKLDILITTPAAYIEFTRKKYVQAIQKKVPGKIMIDRLQIVVVIELEEVLDAERADYSKYLMGQKADRDFTVMLVTHTQFMKRGNRKEFHPDYSERRANLLNILSPDYGAIVCDPSLAQKNFVVLQETYADKLSFLRVLLFDHFHKNFHKGNNENFFSSRVLIVVEDEMAAMRVMGYMLSRGEEHETEFHKDDFMHLEKELELRRGKMDPLKLIKRGLVMGVITTNIHAIRLTQSVIDKVIFFDLIPNISSIELNCSKVVRKRYNFFFVTSRDLREKKREMRSMVQYLKDVGTEIPSALVEFDVPPDCVKKMFE